MTETSALIRWFSDLGRSDGDVVGGKNASLGEMISTMQAAGIRVPGGFATTSDAYRLFIAENDLKTAIADELAGLAPDRGNLASVGKAIRTMMVEAELPPTLATAIKDAYRRMGEESGRQDISVATRSSATAEDLPEASFAGQLETFLNVRGEEALLQSCKGCFASLFTDRAISYREERGFEHMKVAVSVGVQQMVRADKAGSGVMFSIDTETGFPHIVLINAAWGLGETVVQGTVDPDEYHVFKPLLKDAGIKPIIEKSLGGKKRKMVFGGDGDADSTRVVDTSREEQVAYVLSDEEILELGRWAVAVEAHYGQPMDMEWAKDGETGELFMVQARPETVQSRKALSTLKSYRLIETGPKVVSGLAIGSSVAAGTVCQLDSADEIERFREGGVLVTGMTDPDWVPIMKKASAIVTDHGGRTSHAAIVSRELGITAIVGAGNAREKLSDGMDVTVSCAEGDEGFVYEGIGSFEEREISLDDIPRTRTEVMVNLANPSAAYRWWKLPADGVGLARMEFIIGNLIKVHPLALLHLDKVQDSEARQRIDVLTRGYEDKAEYFVDLMGRGMARIAAAYHPHPVIVRMSDFKTNEYARLIGGQAFEPAEENPMLGWRGASRYYGEGYRDGFALECRAVRKAREELGLSNIVVMIPFCRSPDEADRVLEAMAENGLIRGNRGLAVFVMIEIPANVILARQFAERFDGFSIGSNDLTQLVLGVDRDNEVLRHLFDERNEAVTTAIADLLAKAKQSKTKTGICGQAPSDHPDFAEFLVAHGIDSISVTPDTFLEVKQHVARAEQKRESDRPGSENLRAQG
ncbi:MAG: phosphoenolpyruvate synthase [Rhodospirillales bacterium]|nr:MAG: phosphoenolpyruvate synthase [Rhodospirillales bacterium]